MDAYNCCNFNTLNSRTLGYLILKLNKTSNVQNILFCKKFTEQLFIVNLC